MQIIIIVLLSILTVSIICGVILIPIPLFRILKYQKQINRPYLTIAKKDEETIEVSNLGKSEAKIISIFLAPELKYFEDLNGTSLAPGQVVLIRFSSIANDSTGIRMKYLNPDTNNIYEQKFSLINL